MNTLYFTQQLLAEAQRFNPSSYYLTYPCKDQAISIDPEHTREIDDAFYLSSESGRLELYIYVANPAAWIPKDTLTDKEAYKRIESIYNGLNSIPLYPSALVNKMSLKETDKADLRVVLQGTILFDTFFNPVDCRFKFTTVQIKRNFSYQEVHSLLKGDTVDPDFSWQLSTAYELATCLLGKRIAHLSEKNKSIGLIDEEGKTLAINNESYSSYLIIQEFMIIFNRLLTEYCQSLKLPLIYRNHQISPEQPSGKAFYSLENCGHSGLNLSSYARFSSPLRRFIDSVNLRIFYDHSHLYSGKSYSLTELQEIVDRANKKEDEKKIFIGQAIKVQYENKLKKSLEKECDRPLEDLSEKDLQKIIDGIQQDDKFYGLIQQEVEERIKAKTIATKTLAQAIFLLKLKPFNLLNWASDNYSRLFTIVTQADHLLGEKAVVYEEYQILDEDACLGILYIEGKRAKATKVKPDRKEAKRVAVYLWLKSYLEDSLIDFPFAPEELNEVALTPSFLAEDTNKNPYERLKSLASQHDWDIEVTSAQTHWISTLNLVERGTRNLIYTSTRLGFTSEDALQKAIEDIVFRLEDDRIVNF